MSWQIQFLYIGPVARREIALEWKIWSWGKFDLRAPGFLHPFLTREGGGLVTRPDYANEIRTAVGSYRENLTFPEFDVSGGGRDGCA